MILLPDVCFQHFSCLNFISRILCVVYKSSFFIYLHTNILVFHFQIMKIQRDNVVFGYQNVLFVDNVINIRVGKGDV